MTDDLACRSCMPCRGGVPPLEPDAIRRLAAAVPDWRVEEGRRLVRRFDFGTYRDALALVVAASGVAEEERHHPDVAFGWGYAAFSLTTHAIGGLHENDFVLAAKIDRLASRRG